MMQVRDAAEVTLLPGQTHYEGPSRTRVPRSWNQLSKLKPTRKSADQWLALVENPC